MWTHTFYHKTLRTGVLFFACILSIQSTLFFGNENLARDMEVYMATVIGVGVSVSPTDINTLTAEITKQKLELEARERVLRENETVASRGDFTFDMMDFVLSGILLLLLTLVVLNYVFDFIRARAGARSSYEQVV